MVILMFEFAFNFYIAVGSSMGITLWNSVLKDQIKTATDYLNSTNDDPYGLRSQYVHLLNFIRLSTAEAIITWIIILPSIGAILLSLADQLIT